MRKISFSFFIVFIFLANEKSNSDPVVQYRAWQFHTLDSEYVIQTMSKAPHYDINTVVFSHEMIYRVSQLYQAPERAERLKQLSREAQTLDLKVWIWVHELEEDVPDRYLEEDAVYIDRPGFWEWLQTKYENLFIDFPGFDGIILTFHETRFKLFSNEEVKSSLSMPNRFAKMINTIHSACIKYDKDFVVRSFLYEPQEMDWFSQGLEKVDEEVILQSKCVPHDWQPYYPHNYIIGKFPNRPLIVEFDCSSEYTGKNRIPYTSPDYFTYRWGYAIGQPGVIGYTARLDHGGYDAVYTPNEINLYTLYRLTQNPALSAEQIWRDWLEARYNSTAAPLLQKALEPSFEVVNKSLFVKKFWITNHSKLPDFDYANSHIQSHSTAKWMPQDTTLKRIELRLANPDMPSLEWILAEKDTAVVLAAEGLQYLEKAQKYLNPQQYNDLYWRLALLQRVAVVWRLYAEAFFAYKVLTGGNEVPGLRERIKRVIDTLALYSNSRTNIPGLHSKPPASVKEVQTVTEELKNMLEQYDKIH